MPNPASLVVVSGSAGWHENDLMRAASGLEIALDRVNFRELHARVGSSPDQGPPIGSGGFDLARVDGVLVRTMPAGSLEQIVFRMDALQRIEAAGVPVVNSPRSLETAIDKYLASARLESASLPVPPTRVTQDAAQAVRFFEELGGDVIVKPLFGSEGKGVERVTSLRDAEERFSALAASDAVLYVQKFISHPGHDVRLFTCGGRVLGAMGRRATEGWQTNVAQGGRPVRLTLDPALEDLALRAAAAVDTEVAGVDVLPDRDGRLWVLEVNGSPGWKAFSAVCEVDVAREILACVLKKGSGVRGRRSEIP